MAKKTKRARKRYSAADRARILAAAAKQNLTAADVQRKYGVKPVTYYSWRKAAKGVSTRKAAKRRGRRGAGAGLGGSVRTEVQRQVRAALPKIVREETARYLKEVLR